MAADSSAAKRGEGPRITVWWCDDCGYWRKDKSTGVHTATNPQDRRGKMLTHRLQPVTFEMVSRG